MESDSQSSTSSPARHESETPQTPLQSTTNQAPGQDPPQYERTTSASNSTSRALDSMEGPWGGETWRDFLRSTAEVSSAAAWQSASSSQARRQTARSDPPGYSSTQAASSGSNTRDSPSESRKRGPSTSMSIPIRPSPASPTTPPRRGVTTVSGSEGNPIDLTSNSPEQSPQRPAMSRNPWSIVLPRWQPDEEVSSCPVCETPFGFFFRKHHCRKCGKVVCASCSQHRITIPRQFIVHPPILNPLGADILSVAPESLAHLSPLGGGEVVRVCNPCVPDPNLNPPPQQEEEQNGANQSSNVVDLSEGDTPPPERPHNARNIPMSGSHMPAPPRYRSSSEATTATTRSNVGPLGGAPAGTLPPPYMANGFPHGSSLATNPPPFGMPTPDRIVSSSSASSPSSSRPSGPVPSRYHHPASARGLADLRPPSLPQHTTSSRNYDQTARHHRTVSHPARGQHIRQRQSVNEEDVCPVCRRQLPPKDRNGGESQREAHIDGCIRRVTEFQRASSGDTASHPAPVSSSAPSAAAGASAAQARSRSSTHPHRPQPHAQSSNASASNSALNTDECPEGIVIIYTATEKDCINPIAASSSSEDATLDCVVCLCEFEPGQELARLVCLCKMHRGCVEGWWRKREKEGWGNSRGRCPTHVGLGIGSGGGV
ncbi:MAG: hypothetical protein M1831_006205 [Alyxoria varia]|nr:MAG: hypothetical protein M1831_006205 [Alyxoria varia]